MPGQFVLLREYPVGFGKSLLSLVPEVQENPCLRCLRQKKNYTSYPSELSLFNDLEIRDTWPDASLADVFEYLYTMRCRHIPGEWKNTMRSFRDELKAVTLFETMFYWKICLVSSGSWKLEVWCIFDSLR